MAHSSQKNRRNTSGAALRKSNLRSDAAVHIGGSTLNLRRRSLSIQWTIVVRYDFASGASSVTNRLKNSPPTPEEIAEHKASAEFQFACGLDKLIKASGVEDPRLIAITLGDRLIHFIMVNDGRELTFAEAGRIAVRVLKEIIKQAKYAVGPNDELIDVKNGKEISPGGLKH